MDPGEEPSHLACRSSVHDDGHPIGEAAHRTTFPPPQSSPSEKPSGMVSAT
jgi:hypothetical protein